MSNNAWRSEPTNVEKLGDELWIGVKGQSNSEIAGSPRNSSRASVAKLSCGGRALFGLGALPGCQTQANSECRNLYCGSQAVGDKLHRQEGKNPDRQLRSPNAS